MDVSLWVVIAGAVATIAAAIAAGHYALKAKRLELEHTAETNEIERDKNVVQSYVDLTRALGDELKRDREKSANLAKRVETLEEEIFKFQRDYEQLDKERIELSRAVLDLETQKEEQRIRHTEVIRELTLEIENERRINAVFRRDADDYRLVKEDCSRRNTILKTLLVERCHMTREQIDEYLIATFPPTNIPPNT